MSVKVEKIEPKPEPTRKYRLTFDDGAVYSKAVHDVTEATAREIYEGLAVHFAEVPCSMAQAGWFESMIREKDAEIARLKAEVVVLREKCPATGVCRWYAEATELRKWLEKIKKHETTACACCDNLEDPTTAGIWAGHALAGEKVPN